MRAAPAVAVRCDGGWFWRALHTGLPAVTAAALVAWALLLARESAAASAVPALMGALLAGCAAGLLAFRFGRPRVALLQWDGKVWTADGEPGRLQLMMDPGFLLVLRLHLQAGGARWLAVSAAEAGPAWATLRAAVYARPPKATPRLLAPERNTD